MTVPVVPVSVWLLAALDPILIAVAVVLGWKADQFGKIFLAAIAAVAVSVPVAWLLTAIGVPSLAPVGGEYPTLLPVRTVAAVLWAGAAYGARRIALRRDASG